MRKLTIIVLVLILCSTANAGWVRGTSVSRTRIMTDINIPTVATTAGVDCRDFNGILIESSSNTVKILRPYVWSDTYNRYMFLASGSISTLSALTASRANITIGTGATIAIIPNTYGYSNVFVAVVSTVYPTAGKREISYTVTPVQLIEYQR